MIDRFFGLLNNWISVNDGFLNFTETPEAIRIRYRMPDDSFKYMKKSADIENYIKALCRHFQEKGWLDNLCVYTETPDHNDLFSDAVVEWGAFHENTDNAGKTGYSSAVCTDTVNGDGSIQPWKYTVATGKGGHR